jgi:hypothetical protein
MFIDDEHDQNVNAELLETVLGHLRDAGLETKPSSADRLGEGSDLVVVSPSGRHEYAIEIKRAVSRESAAAVNLPQKPAVLVVAPFVPEGAAGLWRARGIDYVDAAGNMHLQWGATLIDVRGRRRQTVPSGPRAARMFQPRGLQIIFALLWRPDLVTEPMRTIATASRASLGAVKHVVDELVDAGYVLPDRSGRRLVRSRALFGRWVEAYTLTLAPRLWIGDFNTQSRDWWRSAESDLRRAGVQLGGESAASLLGTNLQTSQAILYADRLPEDLALAYRWYRSDEEPDIRVRRRFWSPEPDVLAPSPLIYADLMASGDDRQREAATSLRETDGVLRRIDAR